MLNFRLSQRMNEMGMTWEGRAVLGAVPARRTGAADAPFAVICCSLFVAQSDGEAALPTEFRTMCT